MAITLVSTPAHQDADSYVSLAYASAFLAKRQTSRWSDTATTDDDKCKALIAATRDVDSALRHLGYRPYLDLESYYYEQALVWPWDSAFVGTASGGTTTTIVDDGIDSDYTPRHFFRTNATGAAFIDEADDAAPEHELQAVTNYVASTSTFTTAAFTAAVEDGDSVIIFGPVPQWLAEAVCLQAEWVLTDQLGYLEKAHQGVTSHSRDKASVNMGTPSPFARLCLEAHRLIETHARPIKRIV